DTDDSYVLSVLQVVQEYEDQIGKGREHATHKAGQGPVVPNEPPPPRIERSRHHRPEIPPQLGVHTRKCVLQEPANVVVIPFTHRVTPTRLNCSRKRRTARNTLTRIAPSDVPRASAISLGDCSSIRESVAATRSFNGKRRKATAICRRVSRDTIGSVEAGSDRSSGSATSRRV